MVLPVGIDTPRSEIGNFTTATNFGELDFSQEQSFQSPSRGNNDLLKHIQNNRRGITLKTPRSRMPFGDRHNIQAPQGEFTPLLKSVTRSNLLRTQGNLVTPSVARRHNVAESPALPAESSGFYDGGDTENSYDGNGHGTPAPQMLDSSGASTPLAMLPTRGGGGVLADGAASMTLKEQENIVNEVKKENFGLKLKIHFLEDSLRKCGPGYNEAALKENTELKVDKVTLQKELHRYRKIFGAAEHELEQCRQQVLDFQEKTKRKHADDGLLEELEQLRGELDDKEVEVQELRGKQEGAEQQQEVIERLRESLSELEFDLREKDRIIEEREDEIDSLREKAEQAANIPELEQQLSEMRQQVSEYEDRAQENGDQSDALEAIRDELTESREKIQDLEENLDRFKAEVEEVKEDLLEALGEKEKAEENLNELREEMANKSFSTKGLNRQLEEKARKIQDELECLRQEHAALRVSFDEKAREARKAQDRLEELGGENEVREQRLKDDLELTRHQLDIVNRERTTLSTQLQKLSDELQVKAEEKSLLRTRHDSLSSESSSLQKELSQAKAVISELENEKQLALGNERALKGEHKAASDHLNEMVSDLQHRLEEEERRHDANMETWDGERRNLEARRERAEEKAAGLQHTIAKLQEAEGTLSGQEMHLREALASEKERHEREEAVLARQIEELNADIETRRGVLGEVRAALATAKEEVRERKRAEEALGEKIQGLEDEIEISLEVVERATEDAATARAEAEGTRRQWHSVKQDLAKAEAALVDAKVEIGTFREELRTGEASNEHLTNRLADIETQLGKVKREKQALQDQLANVNIQMHSLRAEAAETEAERDEIRSQLQHTQQHVDVRVKLDQEKLELRRVNMRLEADIGRSREENQALEKELELKIQKMTEWEAKFNSEIADLRVQLGVAVDGKDKELSTSKRQIQRLELRVNELEGRLYQNGPDNDLEGELSIVRRDLADARANETEYLEREAAQKENIRQLKRKVVDLERDLHAARVSGLVADSPRSSVGSAQKNEIVEVRSQLTEALQQVKELKVKVKNAGQDAHSKSLAANRESQAKGNALEREKDNLEQELRDCRDGLEMQIRRNTATEQSIGKLRTKVQLLETELRDTKLGSRDRAIAGERRDLHDMLKNAKIEVEDLQFQISDRDSRIESLTLKEKDLRSQLRRVREERSSEARKANATTTELQSLHRRYERALDKAARIQSEWEAERKAVSQRVRFPNTSISSVHDSTEQRQLEEQRHQGEIKGLVRQIQYLRSKCHREETFRADLAYSKKFFLMQIELYNACNHADLRMIEEMGISPDRSTRERRPRVRSVIWLVVACVRMRKMQKEWAVSKKLHVSLAKTMEQLRRRSRRGVGG